MLSKFTLKKPLPYPIEAFLNRVEKPAACVVEFSNHLGGLETAAVPHNFGNQKGESHAGGWTLDAATGKIFTDTRNAYQFRKLDGTPHPNPATDDAGVVFPALLKTEKSFFEGQPTAGQAAVVRVRI